MPREYTILLNDLVEDDVLDAASVLQNLMNWMSEDDVYRFCKDEYNEIISCYFEEKFESQEVEEDD